MTSFDDFLAQLRSSIPTVRIERANQHQNPYLVRRPTGILSLDLQIGGGFPAGGITELWGEDNAGKNLLANLAIAENQRIYGSESRVAVCCVEYPYDKSFARLCGVKVADTPEEIALKKDLLGRDLTDEEYELLTTQVGEIIPVTAPLAEQYLEVICRMIEEDLFQIILLDSVAALLANDEAEVELLEPGMTGMALPRLMSRFTRRIPQAYFSTPNNRPNLTTLIVTNQLTAKVGGFSRPGMPPPVQGKAGYSLRHSKLLSVRLKKGDRITSKGKEIGHKIKWIVTKGKAGCSDGAAGVFNFYRESGVDLLGDFFSTMKNLGLIELHGSYYSFPSGGEHLRNIQGKAAFLEELRKAYNEQKDLFIQQAYAVAGVQAVFKWKELGDESTT